MAKVKTLLTLYKFYAKCLNAKIEKEKVLKALAMSANIILKLECNKEEAVKIPSVMANIFPDINFG